MSQGSNLSETHFIRKIFDTFKTGPSYKYQNVTVYDELIQGLKVRFYKPSINLSLYPTLIYYHGGGYLMGSIGEYISFYSILKY